MIDREIFVKEIYEDLLVLPKQVLSIFTGYYGEDNVDLQGIPNIEDVASFIDRKCSTNIRFNQCIEAKEVDLVKPTVIENKFNNLFIIIRFGDVTVTNEYDRSTEIKELWAKVMITTEGTIKGYFQLNRSEYNILELHWDYLHSHVHHIPTSDFTQFQDCCLGYGPIKHTMGSLMAQFDEDTWGLFCFELEKYTQVESIEGAPYRKIEDMKYRSNQVTNYPVESSLLLNSDENAKIIKSFTEYFLSNNELQFNFYNGSYGIAMHFTDFLIHISNSFIEWYNKEFNAKRVSFTMSALKEKSIISTYSIKDKKIYQLDGRSNTNYSEYNGKKVCIFKGETIRIRVTDESNADNNNTTLLHIGTASKILTEILKFINFKYGNSN
jgi:hypothetical protein